MTENSISALVSANWLKANHPAPHVHVFDVTLASRFEDRVLHWDDTVGAFFGAHIPGARYLDLRTELSDPEAALPLSAPSAERVADVLEQRGIGGSDTVVFYDTDGNRWATRAWWTLHATGHEGVVVLDGGLGAWQAIGEPTASGAPEPAGQTVVGALTTTGTALPGLADIDVVQAVSEQGHESDAVLVHALDAASYRGDEAAGEGGHIPGAVNVPWTSLLDPAGRFLPPEGLRQVLSVIPETAEPVVYCGSGVSATAVLFALREAGRGTGRLYDGSLREWIGSGYSLRRGERP